jgi:hypothetical protein
VHSIGGAILAIQFMLERSRSEIAATVKAGSPASFSILLREK